MISPEPYTPLHGSGQYSFGCQEQAYLTLQVCYHSLESSFGCQERAYLIAQPRPLCYNSAED